MWKRSPLQGMWGFRSFRNLARVGGGNLRMSFREFLGILRIDGFLNHDCKDIFCTFARVCVPEFFFFSVIACVAV